MNKRVLLGIFSAITMISAISCGTVTDEPTDSTSVKLPVEVKTQTIPITTTSVQTEADATSTTAVKKAKIDLAVSITAEQAQEIADKGIKALREQDIEGMVRYTTITDLFRMEHPDITDEDIIEKIRAVIEKEGIGVLESYSEGKEALNFKLTDPVLMTDYDADKLNEILDIIKENGKGVTPVPVLPEISGGYKFKVDYGESSLDESLQDKEAWLYVLCSNGEYRLDIFYSLMAEVYGLYEDMRPETTEITSDPV